MNPLYLGDSYDIVKRFFCAELSKLGYSVVVDPMLTGRWDSEEQHFYRLIGATPQTSHNTNSHNTNFVRGALFIDPDTGVNDRGGKRHVSFRRICEETNRYELVFAFDQSFSRQAHAENVVRKKLEAFHSLGCHAIYYDSHARFVFVARQRPALDELRVQLIKLGIPERRLHT